MVGVRAGRRAGARRRTCPAAPPDLLPTAEQALVGEARSLGRADRGDVPGLDVELEPGDAEIVERPGAEGGQGVARRPPTPGRGHHPVADRGPTLVDVVEPQADRPHPAVGSRLGDDEGVAEAVAEPVALALHELPGFGRRRPGRHGGDQGDHRVAPGLGDHVDVPLLEPPQTERPGAQQGETVGVGTTGTGRRTASPLRPAAPPTGRFRRPDAQRRPVGGSPSRGTCQPAEETFRGS